ncbi:hypothetical protein A2369_01400 [candidate division WS6 bacterium RIFOXYB1_FULL_33_15]|nr:MAG: hypothetical protein A2369_01400 [candidate division WS6 bacterium RIFOXYB1_FULL_33_15]
MFMLEEEELENQYLLIEALSERYPQMLLSPPLLPEEVESYVRGMNSYEREFVKILQNRGLIVFREPELCDYDCKPDFFVYNPYIDQGKIVEVTLLNKEFTSSNCDRKTKERKIRQFKRMEASGIPFVVMYRENLENIREYCCRNLF